MYGKARAGAYVCMYACTSVGACGGRLVGEIAFQAGPGLIGMRVMGLRGLEGGRK